MKTFIEKNTEFLKCFHTDAVKGNLLVEEMSGARFIAHCMCMQVLIINRARGFRPFFLDNTHFSQDLAQSYVPTAAKMQLRSLNIFEKITIILLCGLQLLKAWMLRDILALRYGGVQYGDIVYDLYLSYNSKATFDRKSFTAFKKVARIFLSIAIRHQKIKNVIKDENINAVLVSHKIGFEGGVLTRAALAMNIPVYSNAGIHRNTLYLTKEKRHMKAYEYSPTQQEIKYIMGLYDFGAQFDKIMHEHLHGSRSLDAKFAFNDAYELFSDRNAFCSAYEVDAKKKNIFVMLHAFSDHPHSHFTKMLFADYKDWFIQTLDFAKKHSKVNWFFKRHPSDKYYPVTDVDFGALFTNIPDHIKFLDISDPVDARNLRIAADAVVTCMGSAGFEMPALYGIPSLIAGDNVYSHLSFTKYPRSRREYFSALAALDTATPLTLVQQKEARAFYMFRYAYATVDYSFNPVVSFEDLGSEDFNAVFYNKVLECYASCPDAIKGQIASYAFEVSRSDFTALRTKMYIPREEYFSFPFDLLRPLPEWAPDILVEGCRLLNALGVHFCIADGTLLGIFRDGRLIPHDRDIDICAMHPINEPLLLQKFFEHGFAVGRYVAVYGKAQQIAFYKNEVVFDIELYEHHGDSVLAFCENDYYFKHAAKHYVTFDHINFHNELIPIPAYPQEWLKATYGSGWNIPRASKADDWRDEEGGYGGAIAYDGNVNTIRSKYIE